MLALLLLLLLVFVLLVFAASISAPLFKQLPTSPTFWPQDPFMPTFLPACELFSAVTAELLLLLFDWDGLQSLA